MRSQARAFAVLGAILLVLTAVSLYRDEQVGERATSSEHVIAEPEPLVLRGNAGAEEAAPPAPAAVGTAMNGNSPLQSASQA